ncbi:MAG: hypothetical protein E7554_04155 [Ruminococcaceae bacterium]|nr:hypothetical protein [Oscillospiraceae bacterium]
MIIEYLTDESAHRVLVTMDAAELDGYGVSFGDMSLNDTPTRALLRDLVSMVTRMGLRGEGEQVQVDCAPTGEGGCTLLISAVNVREYVFVSSDDIISAYKAGVLPEGRPRRSGSGWTLRGKAPVHPWQRRILSEYCTPESQ